jgi:hypothetical protein
MNILKVEGSETLDRGTPESWRPESPVVLREHLGVNRWYFRDANWSPDFSVGAIKVLELYRGEGGKYADSIDGVIGITTDVFASLLLVTGPVAVGGINFDSANAVEKLEYEVEYGYADKGTEKTDRKDIMQPLAMMIISKLGNDWSKIATKLWPLFLDLSAEKHLFAYFIDNELQTKMESIGLAGRVGEVRNGNDALLWVDANLAALKTDYAIKRTLNYSLEKINDEWQARAAMQYTNTGKFDWRTTRYRTYARVFAPKGSVFLRGEGAMKWDRTNETGVYDSGAELERSWFGAFISVEPGETKTLTFEYVLPREVGEKIAADGYALVIEKQNGLPELGLTLNLNFDKNITKATPSEDANKYGDSVYEYATTTLRRDLSVGVDF